jgi:hypothetical protein
MEQSYEGHHEVDAVKDQMANILHGDPPADVTAQAKTLDASLTKIGDEMPRRGGFGGPATPEPDALHSFQLLNDDYNTMVSMMQVGLDMAPTPAQIATWESDCNNMNRTTAEWKKMQPQITDFNAVLEKNQMQAIKLDPIKVDDASCSFAPEAGRKGSRKTSAQ